MGLITLNNTERNPLKTSIEYKHMLSYTVNQQQRHEHNPSSEFSSLATYTEKTMSAV